MILRSSGETLVFLCTKMAWHVRHHAGEPGNIRSPTQLAVTRAVPAAVNTRGARCACTERTACSHTLYEPDLAKAQRFRLLGPVKPARAQRMFCVAGSEQPRSGPPLIRAASLSAAMGVPSPISRHGCLCCGEDKGEGGLPPWAPAKPYRLEPWAEWLSKISLMAVSAE